MIFHDSDLKKVQFFYRIVVHIEAENSMQNPN
jgi:hypothetical protein